MSGSDNSGWKLFGQTTLGLIGLGAIIGLGVLVHNWGYDDGATVAAREWKAKVDEVGLERDASRDQAKALHYLLARRLQKDEGDALVVCLQPDGSLASPAGNRCQQGNPLAFSVTYNAQGNPILGW